MKQHQLILIYGDNVGRHDNSSAEMLEFLQRTKDILGEDELRNQFQLSQRNFATKQEKDAFIAGVEACDYEHEDTAIIEDGLHSGELLEIFGQKPSVVAAASECPTFNVNLTKEDLELLSDICHNFKDYNRNCEDSVLPVMKLEATLQVQTTGVYEPDTTYDIRSHK